MNQKEQELTFKSLFLPFTTKKAIVFIIIIGFIVFSNGLFNNFVGDDEAQVTGNAFIHSISNIYVFFTNSTFFNGVAQSPFGSYYKPLLLTFFSIIYSIFGQSYFAFHFAQLIIHLFNTIFLFLVLRYFLKNPIAFILSLIFLIHPINSETVFYISDMQDVLFFFFGIIALWIVQRYHSQKSLIVASVCLLFSLLSKETGALFLFITVAYSYLFKKRNFIPALASGGVVFVTYMLLRIHAIGIFAQGITSSTIAQSSLPIRLLNIPAMFFYYLKTFLFPIDLAMSYQWVYVNINISHFWFPLLVDLLFIILISCFAYFIYKKQPRKYFKIYLFFASWFLLGMLFHMQILPLDATVADRWFYFPIVGLLGMLGLALEVFQVNLRNKWILVIVAIILTILSVRTFTRGFDWKDNLTIATHDVKVSKESWGLESLLSSTYGKAGQLKEAKIHAERSIKLYPHMINYLNLGIIDAALGDYKDAKEAYLNSIKLGDYYQTYVSLAYLDTVYGEPNENINFIKNISLKKFPNDARLWMCLAILEYNQGNKDSAKTYIQKAVTREQSSQIISAYNVIMNGQLKRINVKL